MSTVHADDNAQYPPELINQHAAELRGLAKEIHWLRAKYDREESFRWGLVFEKKYMQKQIRMFELWYGNTVLPATVFIMLTLCVPTAIKWIFSSSQKWDSTPAPRRTLDFVLAIRLERMRVSL